MPRPARTSKPSANGKGLDVVDSKAKPVSELLEPWLTEAQSLPAVLNAAPQSSISPERLARICQSVADGTPLEHAATAAGISARTLRQWRDDHADLAALIDQAEASGIEARVKHVARQEDWKATAWLLARHAKTREHFRPSEHGQKGRVSVNLGFGFSLGGTQPLEASTGVVLDHVTDVPAIESGAPE